MFQDTRPAELDAAAGPDPWSEFRVSHPQERLRLLRELRDAGVPVMLNAPDGDSLAVTLWAVDPALSRLNFSSERGPQALERIADHDEAVAVAYLESVKLQFDLAGFTLVRGAATCALQCGMPREIYRFQRRGAYRVRTSERSSPHASLRHPALPDMRLALRVLDVSIGGCALWLPNDVPPLQAGTRIGDVHLELDAETRFAAGIVLQHVGAVGGQGALDRGARLGCEWFGLDGPASRALQRWIDRAQRHRRLMLG
jgi:c-di-GMP-binding flagellar brake protein YcgR